MNIRIIAILFSVLLLGGCDTVKPDQGTVAYTEEMTPIDTVAFDNIHLPEYQSRLLEVRYKSAHNYFIYGDPREIYDEADSLYNYGLIDAGPIRKGAKYGFISGAILSAVLISNYSYDGGWSGIDIPAIGEIIAVTTIAGLAIGSGIYAVNKFNSGRRMSEREIVALNKLIKKYNVLVSDNR